MIKKVPAREAYCCDLCEREYERILLTKCIVCRRDFCSIGCKAYVTGCIHPVALCKECGKNALVLKTIEKFAEPLRQLLEDRDTALKRYRKRAVSPMKKAKNASS